MTEATRTKSYSLHFENRPGYLFARIDGEKDGYEVTRQFWTEIAEMCASQEVERLFVEENLKEQIPTISEMHQTASERPYMGLDGIKIAFYDSVAEHYEQNQFGELVIRNRGLDLKVFNDPDEALKWLTEE